MLRGADTSFLSDGMIVGPVRMSAGLAAATGAGAASTSSASSGSRTAKIADARFLTSFPPSGLAERGNQAIAPPSGQASERYGETDLAMMSPTSPVV